MNRPKVIVHAIASVDGRVALSHETPIIFDYEQWKAVEGTSDRRRRNPNTPARHLQERGRETQPLLRSFYQSQDQLPGTDTRGHAARIRFRQRVFRRAACGAPSPKHSGGIAGLWTEIARHLRPEEIGHLPGDAGYGRAGGRDPERQNRDHVRIQSLVRRAQEQNRRGDGGHGDDGSGQQDATMGANRGMF